MWGAAMDLKLKLDNILLNYFTSYYVNTITKTPYQGINQSLTTH